MCVCVCVCCVFVICDYISPPHSPPLFPPFLQEDDGQVVQMYLDDAAQGEQQGEGQGAGVGKMLLQPPPLLK